MVSIWKVSWDSDCCDLGVVDRLSIDSPLRSEFSFSLAENATWRVDDTSRPYWSSSCCFKQPYSSHTLIDHDLQLVAPVMLFKKLNVLMLSVINAVCVSEGWCVQGSSHPSVSSTRPSHPCDPRHSSHSSHSSLFSITRDPQHPKLHLPLRDC